MSVLHEDVVCIKSTMTFLMYGKSFHSTEHLTPLNKVHLLSYSSANCESHCYYSVDDGENIEMYYYLVLMLLSLFYSTRHELRN